MGFLRRIETGLERVFEGGIGRTFRSHVQPPEIARKLRKEMDDHRTISVSQVYVPNIYSVFLAPDDRTQFATYEASLRTELAGYLTEYARRESYTLPGRVRVVFETADELDVGMFGIAIAIEEEPRLPDEAAPAPAPAAFRPDPVYEPEPTRVPDELPPEFLGAVEPISAAPPPTNHMLPTVPELELEPEPEPEPEQGPEVAQVPAPVALPTPPPPPVPAPAPVAASIDDGLTHHLSAERARAAGVPREEWVLTWDGGRHVIDRRALVLGRGRECDVVLDDRNVSRRHAEIVRQGDAFVLRDLDSTNGCAVNGRRIRQAPIAAGDTITLGTVSMRLEHAGGAAGAR